MYLFFIIIIIHNKDYSHMYSNKNGLTSVGKELISLNDKLRYINCKAKDVKSGQFRIKKP